MPTPSEEFRSRKLEVRNGEWAARTDAPRRSVFGNYRADNSSNSGRESAPSESGQCPFASAATNNQATLQAAIDLAMARSFLHRFLAKAYEDPTEDGWRWLTDGETRASLLASVTALDTPSLDEAHIHFSRFLIPDRFDEFKDACLAAFGHAARGSCPFNEIEYGDIKADGLYQPHRLADLAAFYRAFGLELAPDADERHDHLCLELEFMCVLTVKEAYALEHQLDAAELKLCRDAQKKFLREHLGRWVPAFTRRLADQAGESALGALAVITRTFVESECLRFGVRPGGEDLLLRPVDEATESLCASCGTPCPPGGAIDPQDGAP